MKVVKKAVICGGHLTPAIAVMECLLADGWQLHYFGRLYSLSGEKIPSLESVTVSKYQAQFIPFSAGKLPRHFTWRILPELLKIPIGFLTALIQLNKIRPGIIISFGGFLALPVSYAGKILGIPVVTHEQTAVMGLANRLIGRFARLTYLSYEATGKVPASAKVKVTGMPMRSSIVAANNTKFNRESLPMLFITGGSQGSHSINRLIYPIIRLLLNDFRIILQCGESNEGQDFRLLVKLKNSLPAKISSRFRIVKTIDIDETGSIFRDAAVVVGRSGANTVAELCYFRKKAVLIPLPWSAEMEQRENARFLEKAGMAIVLDQNKATPESLKAAIYRAAKSHLPEYSENSLQLKFDPCAKKLVNILGQILN
ncbi:MAG: hypothetical protein UV73_C0001G0083 [Candidatus Gottesmanbacteria bacterium GW2011_GWA2_43_14]|uniref:UDP-N-acetylglucosamine--N-acetylmuramyl-(pentapeptide) pyrophosphoryl-undecaprenol N-acetylglucosamine transferase n=1 Tax=Candidatus Gottesmanbacteria bacterium GW2011_GWA2_43_14 TaxID=1618443 RepID=A0A0G1DLV3_9BACT|nr:MAG: hypothetical protein UV73_C0001G0083 [Candidatus Gottesmanbacteria bacterium GW2011_GWA2_43_14]